MGINELLDNAGLYEQYHAALRNEDCTAMIPMLVHVGFTQDEAVELADKHVWDRYLDDQRKALDAMSLAQLGEVYAKQLGRPADLSIGAANLKELILTDIYLNRSS